MNPLFLIDNILNCFLLSTLVWSLFSPVLFGENKLIEPSLA